jgi:hypothetical protein
MVGSACMCGCCVYVMHVANGCVLGAFVWMLSGSIADLDVFWGTCADALRMFGLEVGCGCQAVA